MFVETFALRLFTRSFSLKYTFYGSTELLNLFKISSSLFENVLLGKK